jgi:hypothetical protein
MHRRHFLGSLAGLGLSAAVPSLAATDLLPLKTTFRGKEKFDALVTKALAQQWATKPIGQRMALIAVELRSTPYVGYTLEIDDKIESPSVNLEGLDCWTFFETVLCLARMLEKPKTAYTPQDLLAEIEWTRYRAGKCTGNYLERIHYLNEWFVDNFARGTINDITNRLGADIPLKGRLSREMTVLWKSYRYLRCNPELRPKMAALEEKVNALPVRYIPEAKVAGIEPQLRNGDIIGIVSAGQGGVCSHVGLIFRPSTDGLARFMHASSKYKKVTLDVTISEYLTDHKDAIGILVGRALPVTQTVTDPAIYQANLQRITSASS